MSKDDCTYIVSNLLFLLHVFRVGVDKLVAEGTVWQVRALWDVEDLLNTRLAYRTTSCGPKLSKDAEEGALAAAVRTSDHEVHSGLDFKTHLRH
jgi:hypothetical protein